MTDTQAGDYAIGMIKINGLEPTDEFKQFIEKEKRGEVSMDDLKRLNDWRKGKNYGRNQQRNMGRNPSGSQREI